jgi:membrane-associated phospholipid phosphatase
VSIDGGGSAATLDGGAAKIGGVVRRRESARSRWWVELAVIAWLCVVYDVINDLAPLRLHAALAHAQGLLHVEQALHIDPEHALDGWLTGHHTLAVVLADYYDNAHFVVTFALLGWLWWRRADLYRPLRNSLVLVNVIAFVVFWRYPLAPPRLLPGFTDVVATTHAFGSWHTGSLASQANQLAAMPSLHISWALWCSVALWRASRRAWVRALALAYPLLTSFSVLATGNHFVLDMVGGLAALALALALARLVETVARSSPARAGRRLAKAPARRPGWSARGRARTSLS